MRSCFTDCWRKGFIFLHRNLRPVSFRRRTAPGSWRSRERRCGRLFGGLETRERSGQGGPVNTALADFFDLKGQNHEELFSGAKHAWEVLPRIAEYLKKNLKNGSKAKLIGSPVIGENVHLGEGTIVEPGVYIRGPAWIGKNCEVRRGAYIRENVIAGNIVTGKQL